MEHLNLRPLEPLEPRITPSSINFNGGILHATPDYSFIRDFLEEGTALSPEDFGAPEIVSGSELRFMDADGDGITIKFDRDVLTPESLVNAFHFEEGGRGSQLMGIDVAKLAGDAKSLKGLDISVTSTAARLVFINEPGLIMNLVTGEVFTSGNSFPENYLPGGNGMAEIGFINGAGIDLGDVNISGDLGKIVAGDSKLGTSGLESLTVANLGDVNGTAAASDVTSVITGALGKLDVKNSIFAAILRIQGGRNGDLLDAHIGGDVRGGDSKYSGSIFTEGTIKSLSIGGDLIGGSAEFAGSIHGGKQIKQLSIGGDFLGGSDRYAGRIDATDIGELSIGGDVHFGKGAYSASIEAGRNIKSIHVEGDVIGGAAERSGSIVAHKNISEASVRGNIDGGIGDCSGYVSAERKIGSVFVGGDLHGSFGERSGSVATFDGKIVKHEIEGRQISGAGEESGQFSSLVNKPEPPRQWIGVGGFEQEPPGSDVDWFSSPKFPGSTTADLSYVMKVDNFYDGEYVEAVKYIVAVSKEFLAEEGLSDMEIFVMGPGRALTADDLNNGDFVLPETLTFADGADGKISVTLQATAEPGLQTT